MTKLVDTRFSESTSKRYLMRIVSDVTKITEIKKWLGLKPRMRQYFVLEFITSMNFEYAGTMAKIVENLLPIFTDDEINKIITGIENNDQIYSSFKARTHLFSIVDSAKNIMSFKKYRALIKKLGY